jgi:hypothetical protein
MMLRIVATEANGEPTMTEKNYTASFTVDQSPEEVFAAVTNVRGWWPGEIDGPTDKLGAEFTYRYEDVHRSTQKITELDPGRKVVWHVMDANINFAKDKSEWNGTDIVFEIARKGDKTELRFTHVGLVPTTECYGKCSGVWLLYQREFAQPDYDGQGGSQPERRLNRSAGQAPVHGMSGWFV